MVSIKALHAQNNYEQSKIASNKRGIDSQLKTESSTLEISKRTNTDEAGKTGKDLEILGQEHALQEKIAQIHSDIQSKGQDLDLVSKVFNKGIELTYKFKKPDVKFNT